jgi:hypothetical protein
MEVFVAESNAIEGIHRPPTEGEVAAHERLWGLAVVAIRDLEAFVADVAGKPLRRDGGQDVMVGGHRPPPGGPGVEAALTRLLHRIEHEPTTPYETHVAYELLHPFMDGNGRSGRALWAWQMMRDGLDPFAMPFLRRFYYQTLDAAR